MDRHDIKVKTKMSIQKKSQITMLIIVGLLIFIVVSLVLYLSKSAIKKQTQQNIKKIQGTPFQVEPIKEFVTQCVDKLAKDALIDLGEQGGVIYKSQGGTIPDRYPELLGELFIKNGNYNVAFNIQPLQRNFLRTDSKGNNYADPPQYPWIQFPYADSRLTTTTFTGYFGKPTLPPLIGSEVSQSFQFQIETFVNNNLADCTDFKIFENQGLEILRSKPNTTVTIGSSDVRIHTIYNLKITNPTTKEFEELNDFTANLDVRLKDLYFFTKALIDNDINDISFKIDDTRNNRNSFEVKKSRSVYSSSTTKGDLITITDKKSIINGKPFEYTFARNNRPPALWYIKNTDDLKFKSIDQIYETDILKGKTKHTLMVDDPDEDPITDKEIYLGDTLTPVNFPVNLQDVHQQTFRFEVSDGNLKDYQKITINRIE